MNKIIQKELYFKKDLMLAIGCKNYQKLEQIINSSDFPRQLPSGKWCAYAVEEWKRKYSFGLLANEQEENKQENFEERFDKKLEQFLQKIA
jgi:hypothetical protein